jgi:hypothetical protein
LNATRRRGSPADGKETENDLCRVDVEASFNLRDEVAEESGRYQPVALVPLWSIMFGCLPDRPMFASGT